MSVLRGLIGRGFLVLTLKLNGSACAVIKHILLLPLSLPSQVSNNNTLFLIKLLNFHVSIILRNQQKKPQTDIWCLQTCSTIWRKPFLLKLNSTIDILIMNQQPPCATTSTHLMAYLHILLWHSPALKENSSTQLIRITFAAWTFVFKVEFEELHTKNKFSWENKETRLATGRCHSHEGTGPAGTRPSLTTGSNRI